MFIRNSDSGLGPLMIALLLFAFLLFRAVYRLTFHPLARFPGPRLAALTSMYGASFDLAKHKSYVKEMPQLHDKYGPIVRTFPNQLHIRDFTAYQQIYKVGSYFDKDGTFYSSPVTDHSLFNILDRSTAKAHKDMFRPYFSKSAIQGLESMVQEKITKFLMVLKKASKDNKVVDLSLGYSCLTADVVMQYSYQKPFGALDAPDFQFEAIITIGEFLDVVPFSWYFPNVMRAVNKLTSSLPATLIKKYMPPLAATLWIQDQCHECVVALKSRPIISTSAKSKDHPTIFDTMLNPDVSKGQFTPPVIGLAADAALMFIAGTDTTANALVQATWHVLSNPAVSQKLKVELATAMPHKDALLDWATLESLPYLGAVIKEALRFSYGVPGRLPRVVPKGGAVMCGWHIPPGTTVANSAYVYHTDDSIFSDPAVFRPERWLVPLEERQELEKRMLSFSRGSRACLGINLAYAELYLTIAHLFRTFDISLHETTAANMEWDDCFVPKTRGHLKAVIQEVSE